MEFEDWIETNWGDISELKYGKALKGYKENTEGFPVFGTNGQIGYTKIPSTFLALRIIVAKAKKANFE